MNDAELEDSPFASVVVPVYNDPEGLRVTLEGLADQTYPDDRHEVLVVDNGSTDDTRSVAREFAAEYDPITLVVESGIQSSYAARNRGTTFANGSVIAFVDADMTVEPDWLADVVEAMSGDVDYLACGVELYSTGDEETIAQKYDRLSGFQIERFVEELHFAPTCCLAVDADLFADVGLFDARLVSSGDLEFGQRVHESGYELHYRPDITMYHPSRESLDAILDKAVRIGRGRQQLRRHYPERYGSPLVGLLNPGTYLPPPPWRLADRFREWESLSRREQLSFYGVVTVAGVARAYGKLREALSAFGTPSAGSSESSTDSYGSND